MKFLPLKCWKEQQDCRRDARKKWAASRRHSETLMRERVERTRTETETRTRKFHLNMHVFTSTSLEAWILPSRQKMINIFWAAKWLIIFSCGGVRFFRLFSQLFHFAFSSKQMLLLLLLLEGFPIHSENNFSTVFFLPLSLLWYFSAATHSQHYTVNDDDVRVPYEALIKFPPTITLIFSVYFICFVYDMLGEWKDGRKIWGWRTVDTSEQQQRRRAGCKVHIQGREIIQG